MPRRSAALLVPPVGFAQSRQGLDEHLQIVLLVGYPCLFDLEVSGREPGHRLLQQQDRGSDEGVLEHDLDLQIVGHEECHLRPQDLHRDEVRQQHFVQRESLFGAPAPDIAQRLVEVARR